MEKIIPSAYCTDYIQKICDKTTSKQEGTVSSTVQKNNLLHPDIDLFSKNHDKNISFVFFAGHKIISTIPINTTDLNINPTLPILPFIYNYSTLSPNFITQSNVTHCSIAACKSIGNAPTDKVYCVLFESFSAKILIHKSIIPQNFTLIPSTNDLGIFLLVCATTSMALMALNKIRFPEFNCNMVVDNHPALIVDSTSLCYVIIFGAVFLDKCSITLDYEHNLVWWME